MLQSSRNISTTQANNLCDNIILLPNNEISHMWMDDVTFNIISVISRQWEGDNERLCAMDPSYSWKCQVSKSGPLISRPVLNPLSYLGSCVSSYRTIM